MWSWKCSPARFFPTLKRHYRSVEILERETVRLRFLEDEFRRIDFLLQNIESTKSVSHRIELPQGTINISIIMPQKGFWRWLGDLLL